MAFQAFPQRIDLNKEPDDFYELLSESKDLRNKYRDDLTDCYEIVADFIKRSGRILVGGMSIDFALKAVGDKLYKGLNIDYDFITPTHHTDAYTLGGILAKKYPDISIIGALHISTMRVRYKFMPVADITYVPEVLYNKIQYIQYEGFKVIHPHFQMIDQLRAMTHMAENPPIEPYLGDRISKDIKRFCMLSKHYGFDKLPDEIATYKSDNSTSKSTPISLVTGQCIGGFPAVIYWLEKLQIKSPFSIKISDKAVIGVYPDKYPFGIFSDAAVKLIVENKLQVTERYHAFLDKLPSYQLATLDNIQYQIFDSLGEKYVAEKVSDDKKVWFMGLYGSMVWVLMQYLFEQDDLCGSIYKQLWLKVCLDFNKPVAEIKYLPNPVMFFGSSSWSDSYLSAMQKRGINPGGKKITGQLPKNAYPALGETVKQEYFDFDPGTCEFLTNDGQKV